MINITKHSFYDAKVFFPVLLGLVFLFGLFQNCSSSQYGYGKDPIQYQTQDAQPIMMSTEEIKVTRLEGRPLNLAAPSGLFRDQGLESCSTARYHWSFAPVGDDSSPVALSESRPMLQMDQVRLSDEGKYYLDVECKGQDYQLGPVILDVIPKLKLIKSNVSDQSVSEGSQTELNASFSGPAEITYRWYYTPKGGSQIALAGKTDQELIISETQVSDEGHYELVATSTEGGIAQSLSSGIGKLTVLPMSSISGSVSGTSQVQVNEPIELTSSVSGTADPVYQWYFNSVVIGGANEATFSIPSAQRSDSGTYSLVVTEDSKDYRIGAVNVVVACGPGYTDVGDLCLASSKECNVDRGSGIQFLGPDGKYGACRIISCHPGYINVNNKCLRSSRSCSVEHGTGSFTYSADGRPGACIVQSCDPGYVNLNNSCERKVCPVANGVGMLYEENNQLVCKVEYCSANYVKYQNRCVSRFQSCTVDNGYGKREYSEKGPGECRVTACRSGYVNISNACVKRECSIENGQGIIALAPNGNVQCRAVSCNSGYFLSGNKCISQSCSTKTGTGYWVTQNGQRLCKITQCKGADLVLINNQCISATCPIANGRGARAIDLKGKIYCTPVACNPGYAIQGLQCIQQDGRPCPIPNGSGLTKGSQCIINSCKSGYVAYNGSCVKRRQSCQIAHGTGIQLFTSSGPGECTVKSCNQGFVKQGNRCVPQRQSCKIPNGKGYRMVYSNGYGQCVVESCNPGYGVTITQECLPLRRPCCVGSGKGYQYLTSYGYSACRIESCATNTSLIMGQCRVNERLLCEPTNKSVSAYGGKVYGHIFSLLRNKYNANVNTATKMSNRLRGHVFLNQVELKSSKGFLYDTQERVVKHHNGRALKNWMGLALYTQLLPPDGASKGHYILALASNDGSALDCKVNGGWKNFINNNNARSCQNIKAARNAVLISRSRPLPVKVKFFQNSGEDRCLRLLYKRVGDRDFKVVPKRHLVLPDETNNLCPR